MTRVAFMVFLGRGAPAPIFEGRDYSSHSGMPEVTPIAIASLEGRCVSCNSERQSSESSMTLRVPCLLVLIAAALAAQPGWGLRIPTGSPALQPIPRLDHSMATDSGSGRALVFGGQTSAPNALPATITGETWEWSGAAWILRSNVFGLQRSRHALATAPAGAGVLLFGGLGTGGLVLGDTHRWTGTAWIPLFPSTIPVARRDHAMVLDSLRQRVVLFGGLDPQSTTLGDTWEWDGSTWTQAFPGQSPPARLGHALAFDSTRGVTVLFGGSPSTTGGLPFGDTWEWDGLSWTQRTPPGAPAARSDHVMAFDPVRGTTQLFGGRQGIQTALGDHWEWDGNFWFTAAASTLPPARFGASLAHDGGCGEPFLFGGTDGSAVLADSWQYSQGGSGGGQANSGTSRLEVDCRGIGTSAGPFTVTVVPGSLLNLRWFGPAGAPYLLALGPTNPGALQIPGVGSLDVGTPPGFGDLFFVIDPILNPGIALNPFGQAQQALYVPPAPPGTLLATIQGAVLQPPGSGVPLVLTASFLIST
jgi:hypothetical protein